MSSQQHLTDVQSEHLVQKVVGEIQNEPRVTQATRRPDLGKNIVSALVTFEVDDYMKGDLLTQECVVKGIGQDIFKAINKPSRVEEMVSDIPDDSLGGYLIERYAPHLRTDIGRAVLDVDIPLQPEVPELDEGSGEVYFRVRPENVKLEER